MLLQEIKRRTTFTVTLDDGRKFEVEYLGSLDHIDFEINSSDISDDIDILKGTSMDVQFFSTSSMCSFTAKINRAIPKSKRNSVVVCSASSSIKKSPRRNGDRISIKTRVKIYSCTEDGENLVVGKLLYEGKSSDISKSGMRLFFQSQVDLQIGSTYVLDFTPYTTNFRLPAKLMQKQKNGPVHNNYYDYGFMFDSDSQLEYGESLIVDIFKAQFESDQY